jgi:hypothetical protein
LSVTDRRTDWRRLASRRSWRKRILVVVFMSGLAITAFGVRSLADYYFISAPSEFRAPYQIEIAWSNITEPRQVIQPFPAEIAVVNETAVWFLFWFNVFGNGTFVTAVALPYRVTGSAPMNGTNTGKWHIVDAGRDGTMIYSKDEVRNDRYGWSAVQNGIVLAMNQSLVYDNHGIRTVVLSLGTDIKWGLMKALSEVDRYAGPAGSSNFTVSFVIPGEATNLQAFPMFSRTWPNPVTNTFQVTWDRVGFETVTLSYAMQKEIQSYQGELGWGSFSLGLGIPTMLAPILDWSRKQDLDERIRRVLHEGDRFARRRTETEAD